MLFRHMVNKQRSLGESWFAGGWVPPFWYVSAKVPLPESSTPVYRRVEGADLFMGKLYAIP